ncbi:MAG: hypothetical protein LBI61_04120 [Puniceicoccales bacterium]|jgi:hypothetical protein|nr:hypothetical protein [Puniceicoccales bacterium]
MKKFFFRRHCLFFTTLIILVMCQILILRHCFRAYGNKILQRDGIAALTDTLRIKREQLPKNHLEAEREMVIELEKYKKFIAETWPTMIEMAAINNPDTVPPNHVAAFFDISNYLLWARESCDALGVEFEPTCSFGFKDIFERNEQPLASEIFDVHRQKEQLQLLLSYLMESRSSYLKIVSVERGDDSRSAYFDNDDVFQPDIRQIDETVSHLYRINFTAFTDSFRNFLKKLYTNNIPVIFRQISVKPNHTFKLTKNNPGQISECLAANYSVVIEFLDIPQALFKSRKNAAIYRKILYQTAH